MRNSTVTSHGFFFAIDFHTFSFFVFSVCQEWSVREDNALAQQLQSQESKKYFESKKIDDFMWLKFHFLL